MRQVGDVRTWTYTPVNVESESSTPHHPIEGRYSNFFKVGYNPVEFILDFGQLYSDAEEEVLHTRIITSPTYARILLDVLRDSVEKYERAFSDVQKHD